MYSHHYIHYTATRRLNAGVGLVGVATTMARNVRYDTKEGRKELHRIAERHAYFVIEASLVWVRNWVMQNGSIKLNGLMAGYLSILMLKQ